MNENRNGSASPLTLEEHQRRIGQVYCEIMGCHTTIQGLRDWQTEIRGLDSLRAKEHAAYALHIDWLTPLLKRIEQDDVEITRLLSTADGWQEMRELLDSLGEIIPEAFPRKDLEYGVGQLAKAWADAVEVAEERTSDLREERAKWDELRARLAAHERAAFECGEGGDGPYLSVAEVLALMEEIAGGSPSVPSSDEEAGEVER